MKLASGFLKLDLADFWKGLSLAVIVVVLGSLQQALTVHGFDFGSYDWVGILNVALTALVAYLGKNLISTPDGAVLGKIGKRD